MKQTTIPQRLAADSFHIDEDESHITIDQELCRSTGTAKALIAVCAAGVYQERDGQLVADYAGCLECGSCFAVAAPGAIQWHYPRGGYGVNYREG
ncbi:MAG: 4Fe-4S dicluster domain-containing protein [Candidatus Dormibacteria bacterium]|jgi:ferredoxin like protein